MEEIISKIKDSMIEDVIKKYEKVDPTSNYSSLYDCFTIQDKKILLWFNVNYTTKMIERDLPA